MEQSMQVCMATLKLPTTRHHRTDRVSGDTYNPVYLLSPVKGREAREQKQSTGTNGTQTARSHTAGEKNTQTRKSPYETPPRIFVLRDRWP